MIANTHDRSKSPNSSSDFCCHTIAEKNAKKSFIEPATTTRVVPVQAGRGAYNYRTMQGHACSCSTRISTPKKTAPAMQDEKCTASKIIVKGKVTLRNFMVQFPVASESCLRTSAHDLRMFAAGSQVFCDFG
eukprot:6196232-Pleurochrysis_carterae.AAC.4